MPRCQPISMLRLDAKSLQGIKRIKKIESIIGSVSTVLTGGKIMQMLFKQSKATGNK